ncbi:MAG: hypothetical protein OXU79_05235 [Gemmatimonadota bacterium]|nr:hypothetical protein [Gemmatimonadota bacterium]
MSEENIVRYSRDDLPEDSQTDWNRVNLLTEAELNEAAGSDPDAPPFANAEDWEMTEILAQIPIDRETFEYCRKHGGGIQAVVRNAVREYMDAHPIELAICRVLSLTGS